MKEYKILSTDGIFYLIKAASLTEACDKAREDGIIPTEVWEVGEDSIIAFAQEEAA